MKEILFEREFSIESNCLTATLESVNGKGPYCFNVYDNSGLIYRLVVDGRKGGRPPSKEKFGKLIREYKRTHE